MFWSAVCILWSAGGCFFSFKVLLGSVRIKYDILQFSRNTFWIFSFLGIFRIHQDALDPKYCCGWLTVRDLPILSVGRVSKKPDARGHESGFLSVFFLQLLSCWLFSSFYFILFQAARIRWETVEQPLRSQEYFSCNIVRKKLKELYIVVHCNQLTVLCMVFSVLIGKFNPDPGSEFFHPGSRVKNIPDPDPGYPLKNSSIFRPEKWENCF